GVVLATQNPADLDYKGLSNTGTWFIGRLQAERDKLRVLDGLEGAAASQSSAFNRKEMDQILSGLGKRMFLLHNVHEEHPEVFQVRWALSYLRGPLTRQQIKTLMDPVKAVEGDAAPEPKTPEAPAPPTRPAPPPRDKETPTQELSDHAPILPPDVPSYFLPLRGEAPPGATLVYRPMALGCGEVYYQDTKKGISQTVSASRLVELAPDTIALEWAAATAVDLSPDDLEKGPPAPGLYDPLPTPATKARSYSSWTRAFADALYRGESLNLYQSPGLGLNSEPGESERAFRVRLQQAAKEARDAQIDKLRAKYAPKLAALDEKIRKAEQTVAKERDQARDSSLASIVKVGTTVLNAVLGRKTLSASTVNKAGSAVRNVGKSVKESGDVARARETAEALRRQAFDLETEFRAESRKIQEATDPLTEALESLALKPRKSNVTVKLVALVWAPYWREADGSLYSAWE
ncbi:MAG: ATP-binding protein, partial [Isosphaeraceae bacterium]